jgi:hypothetical protein
MGKGSNVQKAQAARERNAKKMGKSPEERKAASAKAKQDSAAFMCSLCRQTFMVSARPPVLYQHVVAKHPPGTDPASCFTSLAGYDPNNPEPATTAAATGGEAPKPKVVKKKDDPLDALLDAGLSTKKKAAT